MPRKSARQGGPVVPAWGILIVSMQISVLPTLETSWCWKAIPRRAYKTCGKTICQCQSVGTHGNFWLLRRCHYEWCVIPHGTNRTTLKTKMRYFADAVHSEPSATMAPGKCWRGCQKPVWEWRPQMWQVDIGTPSEGPKTVANHGMSHHHKQNHVTSHINAWSKPWTKLQSAVLTMFHHYHYHCNFTTPFWS